MQNVSLPVFGRGFETYHHRQLRNFLFDTHPRLLARLLSRTGSFFAFSRDSLRSRRRLCRLTDAACPLRVLRWIRG